MKLRIYEPRVLAVDLRHRRLGYAVFEGRRTLVDWGVRVYPAVGEKETKLAQRKVELLIKMHFPSAIAIKSKRWEKAISNMHMKRVVEAVEQAALSYSVQICVMPQETITTWFQSLGCTTKDDIASSLARMFPELTLDLPPKRHAWQSEHPRMTVFDAIALGLIYWHQPGMIPPFTKDMRTSDSA